MEVYKIYRGQVKNGKLTLYKQEEFKTELKKVESSKEPVEIAIAVGNYYDLITKDQRSFYFGYMLPYIGERTGETPKRLHEVFKYYFLSEDQEFSELSKPRMHNYILQIVALMAEYDIKIHYPDEVMIPNHKKFAESLK